MKIAIAAFLAVSLASPTLGRAGSGRQSDTIEVDYEYRAICHWLERNEKAAEESTGAEVVKTVGDLVTLRKETKHGLQVFRLRREGNRGIYRASFVDRSDGELTDYTCEIRVSPLSNRRTQITVTMTATAEKAYAVSVNIELRRSIRGLRAFLQEQLRRQVP
jgi:hypothetical protein